MKPFFKHITAVLLTFIVLFATLSFTVNMHYCGDVLVNTSLFGKAKGCSMKMNVPSAKSCFVTKKNCCSETQIVVDGQENLKSFTFTVNLEQQLFLVAFIYTCLNRFEGKKPQTFPHKNYIPPIVVEEIHKLDEVYIV